MLISIVIPVYNEQSNIGLLADKLIALQLPIKEIIWVNDGSHDESLGLIKKLVQVNEIHKYIDLSRNFGQQVAIQAGLDACSGAEVVIMDADGQDPPDLIPALYEKMNEGYDVVYARRVNRAGETFWKKKSASLFYKILNAWVPFDVPKDVGDFRMCNRRVVDAVNQMPEKNKFLRGQMAWVGFNQTFVNYERPPRTSGTSGYPTRKMWRLAWDAITSFTDFPLKLITWLGLIVTVFAFLVMLYALYSKYILDDFVQGWTSMIIAVMFVGGIQMMAIGIIGAYMHRTHQNSLNRPLYFVKENNLDL